MSGSLTPCFSAEFNTLTLLSYTDLRYPALPWVVPPGTPVESRMEGKDYVMANGDVVEGNRAGQHSIRANDQWRICRT